ncbi:MAG TPA: cyclic nucleotide-binding domain-containing protein, partial [Burkholderiaceae bacterium]|nr:cyclic nucleotide-binding domain-containing protein [Burkholderiaceae bacterium]
MRKGDVEIARFGPGEHFGEMAMVERVPRSATVVVEEDARLLEFTRASLFRILRESKDTGIKLLWNIIT